LENLNEEEWIPCDNRGQSRIRGDVADSGAVLLESNMQAMPPAGVSGSSGTMNLSRKELGQASGGNDQR
jgi:hypothetical protein